MTDRFPGAARLRRRRLVRQAVVVAALLVVLLGVSLLWPRPARGALAVATVSGTVAPTGVLSGTLAGSRNGTRACFSVTAGGTVSVLRFADGWSAGRDLRLIDASGSDVADLGDRVVMLGAPGAIGTLPGCTEAGRIWTITRVRPNAAPR